MPQLSPRLAKINKEVNKYINNNNLKKSQPLTLSPRGLRLNKTPRHGYHRDFSNHPCSSPPRKDPSWNPSCFLIVLTLLGPGRLGQVVKRPIHSHNGTKQKFPCPVSPSKHSLTIQVRELFLQRVRVNTAVIWPLNLNKQLMIRGASQYIVCSARLQIHSIKSHVHISLYLLVHNTIP